MKIEEALTYDDVLLVPQYSEIESRKTGIDLSVNLSKGLWIKHPIIPANMQTVTGFEMAKFIAESGGLAILHRFMSMEEQLEILHKFSSMTLDEDNPNYINHVGFSVGVKPENRKDIDDFIKYGAKVICIDIAHGDSKACIETCKYISSTYPKIFLIAGNVATGNGAQRLWLAGADAVKVGVGPGSLCTTRIETGNGVPQFSTIMEVAKVKKELTESVEYESEFGNCTKPPIISKQIFMIADGGIKSAGDCVKALCFADMIMAGNIFAGTDEAPGEKQSINGKLYKSYVGSSTHKTNHIEGVQALVNYKGPVKEILTKFLEGILSGCSYQGCEDLLKLKENPKFVRITSAGLKESHPHDVMVIK